MDKSVFPEPPLCLPYWQRSGGYVSLPGETNTGTAATAKAIRPKESQRTNREEGAQQDPKRQEVLSIH